MAPPGKRRPGFSRRAQYGVFIGYVVAVGGVLIAALLLAIAIIDPRGFAALRSAALDVTAPIGSAGRAVAGFFGGIGEGISDYFRAGSQNAALRQALAEAQRELIRRQALEYENRRLHALLGLARRTGDEVTVARIIGSSFESPRRLATLSAGSSAGVAPGQPVRSPDGLIGRVLETGRWASRVLLITDGASNVPVRLVRDGTPALAVGRGDGTIELRTLEVGQNPFRRGDILVTSGIGGLYPPGMPVAVVSGADGDVAIARPLADPARMDYAIVLAHLPARRRRPARPGGSAGTRAAGRGGASCAAPRPAGQSALPARAPAAAAGRGRAAGRRRSAAMSRIAGSETEVVIGDLRRRYVPLVSTIAAIALSLLPIVATSLWVPNLGFLILVTWRLMRPEIWSAQVALALGLAADLVSGAPLGQSMLLWTCVFLGFDYADSLLGVRDYWLDWVLAAAAIVFHSVGVWYIALLMGSDIGFRVMTPQMILSVLFYPVAARLVLALDRWRLAR